MCSDLVYIPFCLLRSAFSLTICLFGACLNSALVCRYESQHVDTSENTKATAPVKRSVLSSVAGGLIVPQFESFGRCENLLLLRGHVCCCKTRKRSHKFKCLYSVLSVKMSVLLNYLCVWIVSIIFRLSLASTCPITR